MKVVLPLSLLLLVVTPATPLRAQGTWDAILNIDPYPSPYYSDWDVNPRIATLSVINRTPAAQQVRIFFNVTDGANRIVLSAASGPQPIGAGATVIFENPYDIEGNTERDPVEDELAARTGRLREGDYTACAVVADNTGFSLAESCADFTIVYPDPPMLLGPDNSGVIDQQDPLFQWTPVQTPVAFQLTYVMRVVEIFSGQTPAEALRANIPHYQSLDGTMPSLRYPIDARPFETGKKYAWAVQVLDQNGYAPATNEGRSEIWTFTFDEDPPSKNSGDQYVNLLVRNVDKDSLSSDGSYTGDFDSICTAWGQDVDLSLAMDINGKKAFPDRMVLNNARLVRADTVHDTHGLRQWVIYGEDPGRDRMVLLAGDCGIFNENTRKRWIGSRPIADAEELAHWIPTDSQAVHQESLAKLKFGVRIFSFFQEEIDKDSSALAPVREFLEDHEIEIKPGVNFYGALDATQTILGDIFPLTDDAEIELIGFLGADTEVKGSLSWGTEDKWAVGAEGEIELLVLGAKMPKWNFSHPFVKTLQLGFEVGIGIAAEAEKNTKEAEASASVQGAIRVAIVMEDKNDKEWEGELELPFSREKKHDGETEKKFEPTLTLKSEYAFELGDDVELGKPELEFKVSKELGNNDKGLGFEATLKAALAVHDEDIAAVGVTIERGNNQSRPAKLVDLAKETLKASEAALANAEAKKDSVEIERQKKNVAKSKSLLARNEAALKADQEAAEKAKKEGKTHSQPVVRGEWNWKATVEVGNMSLVNLLDLVQKIVLAAQ